MQIHGVQVVRPRADAPRALTPRCGPGIDWHQSGTRLLCEVTRRLRAGKTHARCLREETGWACPHAYSQLPRLR